MGTENTIGMMAEFIKDTGLRIICMGKAFINGLMDEHMKVNTLMIRNMVTVFTHTQMGDHTKDNGLTENNMERAYLLHHKELKERELGMVERG